MIMRAFLVNYKDLVTAPEIKHATAGKEEDKKLERSSKPNRSSQVIRLCVTFCTYCDSENPAASQLLMCPHICPALTCSLCILKDSTSLFQLKLFFLHVQQSPGGVGGWLMVVAILKKFSEVFGEVQMKCKNAHPPPLYFSAPQGDITCNS